MSIILFNKPYQVMCQFSPVEGKKTLADYIDFSGVYPAGRLDYESEGLLVLTDDGKLQARITEPRHKQAKRYLAQVENIPERKSVDCTQSRRSAEGRSNSPCSSKIGRRARLVMATSSTD